VQKLKDKIRWGAVRQVNNGEQTLFWEDSWRGQILLKLDFPKVYECCGSREASMSECYRDGDWVFDFRRSFGPREMCEWEGLLETLGEFRPNGGQDRLRWCLEKSVNYSTRSMYRAHLHRGVINLGMRNLWGSKLPMKLKVFMWQVYHDRLQTGVTMKSKKWKGNPQCTLCGALETGDHLFFKCVLSRFIWASFKEALGWERAPDSLQDILDNWIPLGCADYKSKIFMLGVVLWAIWVTRNKIAIEGVAPKSPIDVLYKIHFFL
jgi:hypothetical protein